MSGAIQLLLRSACVLAAFGVAVPSASALPSDSGSAVKAAGGFESLGLQKAIVDRTAMDDIRALGEECRTSPAIALIVDDYLRGMTSKEAALQAVDGSPVIAGRRRIADELRQRTREFWESVGVLCHERAAELETCRRAWSRRAWLLQPGDVSGATFSRGIDLIEFVKRDFETRLAYSKSREEERSPEFAELHRLLEEYACELDPLIAAYADDMLGQTLSNGELNEHWYVLDRVGRKHAQRVADWIGRRSGSRAALLWRERFLRASDPAYFGILTPEERRIDAALATKLLDQVELPAEVRTLLDTRWSVAAELRNRMWRNWLAFVRHEEPSDELRETVAALETRLNVAVAAAGRRMCRSAGDGEPPPGRAMWGFWLVRAAGDEGEGLSQAHPETRAEDRESLRPHAVGRRATRPGPTGQ